MAPPLVLRLGRRMTAWEKTDPREVAEVLFHDPRTGGLDLRPSVYLLPDRTRVTQARSEHSASFFTHAPKPTQSTIEWDVTAASLAVPEPSPGTTKFEFTKQAHAELVLSEEDLIALTARLIAERQARSIEVSQLEVFAYIEARLAEDDPEWVAFIGPMDERAGPWAKALLTYRRKRAGQPTNP